MQNIVVEKKPAQSTLDSLKVNKWPTWEKEVSIFPWVFPEQEIAYILEGECVITPEDGKPVKDLNDSLLMDVKSFTRVEKILP